jgi:hypothetical protein
MGREKQKTKAECLDDIKKTRMWFYIITTLIIISLIGLLVINIRYVIYKELPAASGAMSPQPAKTDSPPSTPSATSSLATPSSQPPTPSEPKGHLKKQITPPARAYLSSYELPKDLNEWSSFGQAFGLYACILSFILIAFSLFTIYDQRIQYHKSEISDLEIAERQENKISILQKNFTTTTKLQALKSFIDSQHSLISYEEKQKHSDEFKDKTDDIQSSIEKRKAYIKNCLSTISEYVNNEQLISDSVDINVTNNKTIKDIKAIRCIISKNECIPDCAVITDEQIKLIAKNQLTDDQIKLSNEDEKNKIVKKQKIYIKKMLQSFNCYYSKWIEAIFNREISDIEEDISKFYEYERGQSEYTNQYMNWADEMPYYNALKDLRRDFSKKEYYSEPHVIHYTQLKEIAIKQNTDCLSKFQKSQLKDEILKVINSIKTSLEKNTFNVADAVKDHKNWQRTRSNNFYAYIDKLGFAQKCFLDTSINAINDAINRNTIFDDHSNTYTLAFDAENEYIIYKNRRKPKSIK